MEQARYADRMEALAMDPAFAGDADLQALAADAVMSLAPWKLYTPDKQPPPPRPAREESNGWPEKSVYRTTAPLGSTHATFFQMFF